MKFTNIKQLIIKFMGGGIINFPTRFLRWVKINGDSDGDNEGGEDGSNSDVFFVPATIQPKYFVNDGDTEPIEIKNYTPSDLTVFLYNKEDIISLGIDEELLNNLDYIGIDEAFNDFYDNSGGNGGLILKSNFHGKTILYEISNPSRAILMYGKYDAYVYKISDDVFLIITSEISHPD